MAGDSPIREVVATAGNGPSLTIATSTAPQAGDLLVCQHMIPVGMGEDLLAPTGSGWSLRRQADRGPNLPHLKVWTRVVSTPGVQSVTVRNRSFFATVARLYVIRDPHPTAPVVASAAGAGFYISTSPAPGVTIPAGSGDEWLLICCWVGKGFLSYGTAPGMVVDDTEAWSWNMNTASASEQITVAGATGGRAISHSGGAPGIDTAVATVAVAVRPTKFVPVPPAVDVEDASGLFPTKFFPVPPAVDESEGLDPGRVKLNPVPSAVDVEDVLEPFYIWLGDRRVVAVYPAVDEEHTPRIYPHRMRPRRSGEPVPEPGSTRVMAQRWDGTWLDWDLEVDDLKVTYTLSGPCEISGTITPETRRLLGDDGYPLLTDWGTWIYVEQNSIIRAAGILQEPEIDGDTFTFTAVGFSAFVKGLLYQGDYSKTDVDVLDVVRHLWEHAQSYDGRNLGVTIYPAGIRSGVLVGNTMKEQPAQPAPAPGQPAPPPPAPEKEPYELKPWDKVDIGDEIDKLAKSTPFDYMEWAEWNDDHTEVRKYIWIGYPRGGRRRDDLRFAVDENITELVTAKTTADYADVVLGFGSGDGSEQVRAQATTRDVRRFSRMASYEDNAEKDKQRLERTLTDELARHAAGWEFGSIVLDAQHPNAKLGTFGVGDDLPLTLDLEWLPELRIDHRVTGMTYDPATETIECELSRSDRFTYRGEPSTDVGGGA